MPVKLLFPWEFSVARHFAIPTRILKIKSITISNAYFIFSCHSCFTPLFLRLGNVSSPVPLMHLLNKTRLSINLIIQKHRGSHSERQRVPSSPIDVRPHNVTSVEVYCSVHFSPSCEVLPYIHYKWPYTIIHWYKTKQKTLTHFFVCLQNSEHQQHNSSKGRVHSATAHACKHYFPDGSSS